MKPKMLIEEYQKELSKPYQLQSAKVLEELEKKLNPWTQSRENLIKRIKSFTWRLGAMALIFTLNYFINNDFKLDKEIFLPILAGLLLSEITKQLNSSVK